MNLIIEQLESTVKKYEDKVAVIYKDEKITYKDLMNNSKRFASFLEISINEPVIIFMNKSIDTLISFFGVLYAGGCYSLLNPELPSTRLEQIKETLSSKVVITNNDNVSKAQELFRDLNIINIEEFNKQEINEDKLLSIKEKKLDLDPVYINFTSGSTGVPKGVCINNRSIIDFIFEFTNIFKITDKDILANQAPFDFDVSVKDIYSAIFNGATLLIVPKEYFSKPALLLDYLDDNKATTMVWAVSALCLITTFHGLDYKVPTSVNKVIFSGEVMPLKHLNIWMSKLENATFINVYGPTEITCNCTYHIIDRNREYNDTIPIGKSFNNERVFLLDDNNNLITEENIQGEVCVAGSCLSLGYYNNKEQNDKHFIQNPLNKNYFERIYLTGDLAKYNELGELVFSGRKDFQIKHMGHRIELEEIDKNIMKNDKVINSCTLFDEKKSKLYNFYIGDIDKKELFTYLKEFLPIYMIPSQMYKMDEFPLTKNGKIDRKKLMELKEEL